MTTAVLPRRRRSRRYASLVAAVLSWVVLLAVLAFVVVAVVLPRVAGGHAYTVLSPSMTPTYPPGSLVVVRPVDVAAVGIGDVVTYQLHSGRPEVVTHRVVAISTGTDGSVALTTKGDHNAEADPAPVVPGQVRGMVWFGVPLIGYVGSWLTGSVRLLVLALVVGVLVFYAALMFLAAGRDARARRRTEVSS
jgi:signal peptidase